MKLIKFNKIILLFCALTLGACADSLNITNYKIIELRVGDEVLSAPSNASFNIENNRIYGNAGCNNYFASFLQLENNRIEVSAGGSTRMMCHQKDANAFENAYLRNFHGIFNLEAREGQYIFSNEQVKLIIEKN